MWRTLPCKKSFYFSLIALSCLLWAIFSVQTVSASGELYAQPVEYISVDIPPTNVGSKYYNEQIAGDQVEMCGTGLFTVIKNPEPHSTSTFQNAWRGQIVYESFTKINYSTIKTTYGAGSYLLLSNNVLTCPGILEFANGSGYSFVTINQDGTVEYQQPITFFSEQTQNIVIIEPTYGTTTATTSVNIEISYRTPYTLDFRPATYRWYQISDAISNEIEYTYSEFLATSTLESITIEENLTLATGSKYIRAGYLNQNQTAYSEIIESFFSVVDNSYLLYTGLENPRSNPNLLTQIDCDLFDVGCQFQKVITFLFVPPQNTLDRFANLWQVIAERKPFGYVTVTINQLGELTNYGTPTFSFGTIPFMDSIFTPLKTLVDGILWAVFAITFYQRRLVNLDI